jgi:hypothetical protein
MRCPFEQAQDNFFLEGLEDRMALGIGEDEDARVVGQVQADHRIVLIVENNQVAF